MVFIFIPFALFSSLNPTAQLNLVTGADLELDIELVKGGSLYNIFKTTTAHNITRLTEDEFQILDLKHYRGLSTLDLSLYQRVEMLPFSDVTWNLSPPSIATMKNHFLNAKNTNLSDASLTLRYNFNKEYSHTSEHKSTYVQKKIMDIENYYEIFQSFYEALSSSDCEPIFIRLKDFYPMVVHLSSSGDPEPMNIIFKDLNLKLICTQDPLIPNSIVKYWSLYLDDNADPTRVSKEEILKIKEKNSYKEELYQSLNSDSHFKRHKPHAPRFTGHKYVYAMEETAKSKLNLTEQTTEEFSNFTLASDPSAKVESSEKISKETNSSDAEADVPFSQEMGVVMYTSSDRVTPSLAGYTVITFYGAFICVVVSLLKG